MPVQQAQVVIIGAGPAGSALALGLLNIGIGNVVLVDKPTPHRFRVGESATPDVPARLQRLGLNTPMAELGHRPYHGSLSLWADGGIVSDDFLYRGQGPGWHLDRTAFDAQLHAHAIDAGARRLTAKAITDIQPQSTGWRLGLAHSEQSELQARIVVDASGRRASLAGRLRLTYQRLDTLLGLAVKTTSAPRLRGMIIIEAMEHGWWYAADLPTGECIVILMSDSDLANRHHLAKPEVYRAHWAASTLLRDYVTIPDAFPKPLGFSATSGYLPQAAAPGFISIGDAMLSLDPLTASGISGALADAEAARTLIRTWLTETNPETLHNAGAAYVQRADTTLRRYLIERQARYREVLRYQTLPFWRRRNQIEGLQLRSAT